MGLVQRRGAELRDGHAAARVHREQEHQDSSARVQGQGEQLPLIGGDRGQVHPASVVMETFTARC